MPLTDTKLRALKPKEKRYRVADGNGLYAVVFPNGKIYWWMRFRIDGKDQNASIGGYPEMSLSKARETCLSMRSALSGGAKVEEVVPRKQGQAKSFKDLSLEWLEKKKEKLSSKYAQTIMYRVEKNLLPYIGNISIDALTPVDVLSAIRKIEERGKLHIAKRVLGYVNEITDYAVILGLVEYNPFLRLTKVIKHPEQKNYATIIAPEKIGVLLNDIDSYTGSYIVRMCMQIMPYVFVRSSELRCARWSEIDFASATWLIPAERMKMKLPHIVPLSKQVVAMFKELQGAVRSDFCFPSPMSNSKPITDVAILSVLRRLGYERGQMTVHSFRSMASTLLNEQGFAPDIIERQLAHRDTNKVRAAYNHAEYLDQRRDMMQKWADWLDGVKNSVDTGQCRA